jgi:hypothetical protein
MDGRGPDQLDLVKGVGEDRGAMGLKPLGKTIRSRHADAMTAHRVLHVGGAKAHAGAAIGVLIDERAR